MTNTKINDKDKRVDENSDSKLSNSIKSIVQKTNFLTHKVSITELPSNGVNYMGELTKVNIKGETVNGDKEMNIFVKTKLRSADNIKVLSMNHVYCNELFVYKELSKIYSNLQEDANVPTEERYNFVKCYDESDTESIFLEDIAKKGYVTCKRFNVIKIDYAEKCIENLAKFHALSFVLENKQPEYFRKTIKEMKYPLIYAEEYRTFLDKMIDFCIKHLDGQRKEKMIKFVPNLAQKIEIQMNDFTKVRCLCHGDFRALNVMVKATNGEALRVMPIDYQFTFYGSPVTDIIYFIFGSTDRQFRNKHLANLKNIYHDVMTNFLKYFNMNIDDFYPRNVFDKTFHESLDFSLMISVWYLPVNLANDDEVIDLNKKSLNETEFSINERVKSRLEDVIDDLIEWGYL